MSQLEKLSRRHYLISKLSAAFLYALAVAVALNFFWGPGKIYGICADYSISVRTIHAVYLIDLSDVLCFKHSAFYLGMV